MNGEGTGTSSDRRGARFRRLHEDDRARSAETLVKIVVPVLALLSALYFGVRQLSDQESGGSGPTEPALGTPTPAVSDSDNGGSLPPLSAEERTQRPGCLTAALIEVDCTLPHAYETLSAVDGCTTTDAMRHLAGDPAHDIPFLDVRSLNGRCVISRPDGSDLPGHAGDALAPEAQGDAWRRCSDARRPADVSCDMPHTGEYMGALNAQDCERSAAQYMNASIEQIADRLTVNTVTYDVAGTAVRACMAEILGDDLLDGSIRRLGSNALPIAD